LRCLPGAETAFAYSELFTDPNCTERVFVRGYPGYGGLPQGPVAVPLPPDGCDARFAVGTVRELGRDVSLYSGAACLHLPPPTWLSAELPFVIGEPSAPGDWVAAEVERGEPLVGRLFFDRAETAEGASFPIRVQDERYGMTCRLFESSRGAGCMPPALDQSTPYARDSLCELPLWRVPACQPPAFIGQLESAEHYSLGEPWVGDVYELGKSCRPRSELGLEETEPYVLVGAALPDDAVQAIRYVTRGDGRLKPRGVEGDDASFVPLPFALTAAPHLFDSERGEDCEPIWTPEGLVRCIPSSVPVVSVAPFGFFDDSACSEPIYVCVGAECLDRDVVFVRPDGRGGQVAVSINRSAPITGSYTGSAKACDGSPTPGGAPGFFKAGAPSSWEPYPILQEWRGAPEP
jgi:hypothetical protein